MAEIRLYDQEPVLGNDIDKHKLPVTNSRYFILITCHTGVRHFLLDFYQ